MITNTYLKEVVEVVRCWGNYSPEYKYEYIAGQHYCSYKNPPFVHDVPKDAIPFFISVKSWLDCILPTYNINKRLVPVFDLKNIVDDFKVAEIELPHPAIAIDVSGLNIPGADVVIVHKMLDSPKYISICIPFDDDKGMVYQDFFVATNPETTVYESMLENHKEKQLESHEIRITNYCLNVLIFIMNYNDDRTVDTTYTGRTNRPQQKVNNKKKKRQCRPIPIGLKLNAFTVGGRAASKFPKGENIIMVGAHWRHYRHDRYVNMKGKKQLIAEFMRGVNGKPDEHIEIEVG